MGKKKKGKNQGSPIVKDLRTPKYKKRVVPDKKKLQDKNKCKEEIEDEPAHND